jgi:signal transduction histidine kinase
MRLADFAKRHALWAGFLAVLAPLALLLALQYRWLVKLEHTSKAAHEAQLDNYLEAVSEKVKYLYEWRAKEALSLPPEIFAEGRLEEASHYFGKVKPEGARRLFAISFAGPQKDEMLTYSPRTGCWVTPPWSAESRAVWVAVAPWETLAHKGGTLETVSVAVDERDLPYRILLYPITDQTSRIVGLAGMVVDGEHFLAEVLPHAIDKALPKFFSGDPRQAPVVTVRDARDEVVFTTARSKRAAGLPAEVTKPFSFVFTDWTLGLTSRHATPGKVARQNFAVNVGLSAALASVLLGGVVLALRTASRAMKLSEMKSDFVSNVSHELRTPLASIRVFGELLRLGRVDNLERARDYGEYIETESRRLTQLINNILDFSSIESGRKSYHFDRADVAEVVAETLKTFAVRLRQSGFVIRFERPAAPLPPVLLDASAVAQSLSNLLDNAVKYSNGGREITVTVTQQGGWAVIAVADQGIGIPRDEQRKIFDRFHRVPTGLVHDVKGSGLGLAIVRHIVDAHRGRLTVESKVGEGSTFSIHLPVERAAPAAAAVPVEPLTPGPSEA